MGGEVKRHVLAVRVVTDEVSVLARELSDDRVCVEYMYHVFHTAFCLIRRIELDGRHLRVVERRLEFTALEREVYAVAKTYVDRELSEEEMKDLYDSLANFLQDFDDFDYLFNRLTSEKIG
jgi:hypothetical protein